MIDFPDLPKNCWRPERPLVITLRNGDKIPAYPVIGKIDDDGTLMFGDSCKEKMWMINDGYIENELIEIIRGGKGIIAVENVVKWAPL